MYRLVKGGVEFSEDVYGERQENEEFSEPVFHEFIDKIGILWDASLDSPTLLKHGREQAVRSYFYEYQNLFAYAEREMCFLRVVYIPVNSITEDIIACMNKYIAGEIATIEQDMARISKSCSELVGYKASAPIRLWHNSD